MTKPFYVTTPIYYVNAEPHIGHAYTTIVADCLTRFYILCGAETFFLTGTDEHGNKIVAAAEKAGISPREYVNKVSGLFRELWPKLNIRNDYFIRTTDPAHEEVVRLILNKIKERGDIYFSDYKGLYCFGCERFYTERELVDGKCPDHGTVPEEVKEANYFFRMGKYQDWLIEHIHQHPDFIRPVRYKNEVLSFLKEPLEDLCISRPKSRLTWGIALPFDENYVTYVWFDALINYTSALQYPDGELFQKFWPVAQHIIAKDILKPHAIYWPCMLKAAGIEPYQHLNVHGYWQINEGKMSKSLGNVVKPLDLVEVYGLEAFRYFLLRDMVFGLDSEFSEEALKGRINADLANDLGNLVSRTLTMVHKYCKGSAPVAGPVEETDVRLREDALALIDNYEGFMADLAFHKALMAIWELIGKLNKYIDSSSPWVLAKSDRTRLDTVLFNLLESLKIVSVLIWPFMPQTAEKIHGLLGLDRVGEKLKLDDIRSWGKERFIAPQVRVPHLFPRIEAEERERPVDRKDEAKRKAKAPDTLKIDPISLQEFQKLELRVGTVKAAEAVPGSKKLMKLIVDVGEDRTVVAGILGHYAPEMLIQKQVVLLANLAPVKLMGVESQGMVLAASDDAGVHLIIPDRPTANGAKVK